MKTILLYLISMLMIVSYAQKINVPADINTMQGAIDAANNGDTILVSEGTYYENIDFKGKAIIVSSLLLIDGDTSHISKTIIDGSLAADPENASVVYFRTGENSESVINGFTITGGKGTVYTAAWPQRGGGGIFITSGARVSNNHIINNDLTYDRNIYGAGIFIQSKYPTPEENRRIIIDNNLIKNNRVSGTETASGAGLAIFGSADVIIKNNRFIENRAINENPIDYRSGGGAVFFSEQEPLFYKNVFEGNEAAFGGAISVNSTYPFNGSKLRLINNTLANNNAFIKGGGLFVEAAQATVLNTIFNGNTAPEEADIHYRGTLNITYSITQDSFPGQGNLVTDPMFVNGNYYLDAGSPAIDAGNPDLRFNDREDPENPGVPLAPGRGGLDSDMGAFGGNDTVSVEPGAFMVRENFLAREHEGMVYRFAYPTNYDSTQLYPLTIVLHANSGIGTDNNWQLFIGLPWRTNAEYYGHNEFTFVPQASSNGSWYNIEECVIPARTIIKSLLDSLPIDTTRILLTGWGSGTRGCWELYELDPELYAAQIFLATENPKNSIKKYIPIWLHNGSEDFPERSELIANEYASTGIKSFYTANLKDSMILESIVNNGRVFYSEYEGAGHRIVKHAFDNPLLFEWIERQQIPLIHPENSTTDKKFILPAGDSVLFKTRFKNPQNLEFEHNLTLQNLSNDRISDVKLFDDGQHGDEQADDGIFANYLKPGESEETYRIGIEINNLDSNKYFYFQDLERFTTKGPVIVDSYEITQSPNRVDEYSLRLQLKNKGSLASAENLRILIEKLEDCFQIGSTIANIDLILAGQTIAADNTFPVSISSCTETSIIPLKVSIYENENLFWVDTVEVDFSPVNTFSVEKNEPVRIYPNPFTSIVNIEYVLSDPGDVQIEVFDITGKRINTLVSKNQMSGYYITNWNTEGASSGLYLCKIRINGVEELHRLIKK